MSAVDVLNLAIAKANAKASGPTRRVQLDLHEAVAIRAAVAELIEADVEFDAARAEFYAVERERETANERYMRQGRFTRAGKRRASALARVQGESA